MLAVPCDALPEQSKTKSGSYELGKSSGVYDIYTHTPGYMHIICVYFAIDIFPVCMHDYLYTTISENDF